MDSEIKQTNRKAYFGQTQLISSSSSSISAIQNSNLKKKNINSDYNYISGMNQYDNRNNYKLSISHNDSRSKKHNFNNNSKNNINNINSLYYSTINQKFKPISQSYSSSTSSLKGKTTNRNTNSNSKKQSNAIRNKVSPENSQTQQTWNYHVLPSLYSIYQKVDRFF